MLIKETKRLKYLERHIMFTHWKTEHSRDVKSHYMFNAISIKYSVIFSVDIHKLILKFMWKNTNPMMAKTI